MKHLIVLTHPNKKSFGAAIAETVKKASEKKGAETMFVDLYDEKFNPVLGAADFDAINRGTALADVKKEQDLIAWADVITFIYPVWWSSLPAMLKGYIDRVFAYGFAYVANENGYRGLLGGKKAILISTSGTPSEIYSGNGMHHSMKQTQDEGIFRYSGFDDVKHYFFGAVPAVNDEKRKEYLAEIDEVIRQNL